MTQDIHHVLLILIYLGYFIVLLSIIWRRFLFILPCFSLYLLLNIVKAVNWKPYGAAWEGYYWIEPLILLVACLSLVEALWRAGAVLSIWDRWTYLAFLFGAAIVLLSLAITMPEEWLPLRALERARWQTYVTLSGTAILGNILLPRLRHLQILTVYLLAHGVSESINYRHASTLAMRWRLYYVQTFGYLAIALLCCAAWVILLMGYRHPDRVAHPLRAAE